MADQGGTDKALYPLPECACLVLLQVQLLNAEHNPDVMLLAARAITFLADVLPSSSSSIVRHGAVPAFCARLLTIEYIDLAEQSLQVRTQSMYPCITFVSCKAPSTLAQ